MKKKSLASVEIAAIVNELQFLVTGKVSQIYHQDLEFILQLHAVGQGKQLLKIVPGKLLCLTKEKSIALKPSGFCMQLRKYLDNAVINQIYQKNSERIVIFQLEKEQKFYVIVELFSKGNVILADDEWIIIGVLENQRWKDRIVKPKEKYIFPEASNGWKELSEDYLAKLLKKSDKRNLATSLAIEIGLGGVYAEEVCIKSGVDKEKLPFELTQKEVLLIYSQIKELLRFIENSKGFIYEEQVTPFPLAKDRLLNTTKTYNEAVAILNPLELISPYEKRINALKRTAEEQETAIDSLKERVELNKRKGEVIYEKYLPLQKLLKIVTDLKKNNSWAQIAAELKKERRIKSVDLKSKKVVIDL